MQHHPLFPDLVGDLLAQKFPGREGLQRIGEDEGGEIISEDFQEEKIFRGQEGGEIISEERDRPAL